MYLRLRPKTQKRRGFNAVDLKNDSELLIKYGLKNKKELKIMKAEISKMRQVFRRYNPESIIFKQTILRAYNLGVLSEEEHEKNDYSNLVVTKFLDRRLQTLVARKEKTTVFHARRLITDGHIFLKDKIRRHPGYLIRTQNEDLIKRKEKPQK